MSKRKFGIIGGGLTGLTTAYRLVNEGHDVTIFEAGDFIGGLAAGFDLAGHRVEHAYHFLYKTDEYILALCDELGLTDELTYHKSSVSTYYGDKLYPFETPVDLIKFTPLSFFNRIRAGLVVLWLQRVKDWRSLEDVTALEWLRKFAGKQVTDVVWEPLLRGKFDRYYDKVTMSWLWGRVLQRVDSRDAKLGGEALGYFKGGFKVIIDRLEGPILEKGGEIRYNTPVEKLTYDDGADEVIVKTAAGEERFDRVLATTPSHVVSKLIGEYEPRDPDFFRRLNSIDYLDAVITVFATKQRITKFYWHNVNTPKAPFVVFLSLTELVGTEDYDGLNIYYIGDYVPSEHEYMSMTPEQLKARWYGEIKKMFPEFDESQIVDDAVFKMRNAQHIVDIGFEENKLAPNQTPCPGVLMCNFSQIYPMDRGTNYAVRDGNRMAQRLLDSIGEKNDADQIRKIAPASFKPKTNAVSVDQASPDVVNQAARSSDEGSKKKGGGWFGAIGRFIQRRPLISSLGALAVLAGGALGSLFVGFEIGTRELATHSFWAKVDKKIEQKFFMSLPDKLTDGIYNSSLIRLASHVDTVELDVERPKDELNLMSFTGGGMTSFGDDLLLLPYDGHIYKAQPTTHSQRTSIQAPSTNREAFQALPETEKYKDYSFALYYVRYNDLKYFEDGDKRGLLASYTEYHPDGECATNTVARLDFAADVQTIDDVKAGPEDWDIVYRSAPCLKMKKRLSALEAHMAGGRMVVTGPQTVYLANGDYHIDGMRSDGLGIAQDSNNELGKVMRINYMTGDHEMVSMGHRNMQGIAAFPDGEVYVAEHGPKGGDELNHIVKGANYGWPKVSYGLTYSNGRLPESEYFGRHDGFTPPAFSWMPSPALSSLIYVGPGFHDAWTGDLLAGSLITKSLWRIRFAEGRPVYSEQIEVGSRVRSLWQHTNGQIVIWTDNHELIWLTGQDVGGYGPVLTEFKEWKRLSSVKANRLEAAIDRCAECHSFQMADDERAPSLARIHDDRIASTGYQGYTSALKRKSKEVWNDENLRAFLTDPEGFAPDTAMPAVVVDDPETIDLLIEFLKLYDTKF